MPIGRKKKALLHIAKEDLHLDEEGYRQILKGVAGVESATQLTREGFEKVIIGLMAIVRKRVLSSQKRRDP
jgi:hypothetical protein